MARNRIVNLQNFQQQRLYYPNLENSNFTNMQYSNEFEYEPQNSYQEFSPTHDGEQIYGYDPNYSGRLPQEMPRMTPQYQPQIPNYSAMRMNPVQLSNPQYPQNYGMKRNIPLNYEENERMQPINQNEYEETHDYRMMNTQRFPNTNQQNYNSLQQYQQNTFQQQIRDPNTFGFSEHTYEEQQTQPQQTTYPQSNLLRRQNIPRIPVHFEQQPTHSQYEVNYSNEYPYYEVQNSKDYVQQTDQYLQQEYLKTKLKMSPNKTPTNGFPVQIQENPEIKYQVNQIQNESQFQISSQNQFKKNSADFQKLQSKDDVPHLIEPQYRQIKFLENNMNQVKLEDSIELKEEVNMHGLSKIIDLLDSENIDLKTLSIGMDLTSLGLNLDSPENISRTFTSPWGEDQILYQLPESYKLDQVDYGLSPKLIANFTDTTLFYIFHYSNNQQAIDMATQSLFNKGWYFNHKLGIWLKRAQNPKTQTNTFEIGSYIFFDYQNFEQLQQDNFKLFYEDISSMIHNK
ncbi:ccr4-not transcription complex subunit 2 [Anaeramoeba ignava]|uniref:Ccr4-not transcription complex subunit 2 n=1 Tax=Anaeramoeba ignava TaxID=1746090 RepID=A0A9Q0RBV3_ANAIG|nr:ccr4-not transcription complex subunit 2 [Anaeramoeba ignava]